jgi:F-type H+-transporting ATPase subunit b
VERKMQKKAHKLSVLVPAITGLALFASGSALAEGGGGHGGGHGEPHVANWFKLGSEHAEAPALGWLTVTFVIFVAIIVRSVRRPLNNFLEARAEDVKTALAEAKQAKEDAEAKAREYEDRLAKLDSEIASLKDEFRSRGEAEMKRLEAAGQKAAERVLRDAEDTVAAEFEKAQQALKLEASKIALELAEDRIRGALGDKDHARLETDFIQDVAQ